MLADLGSAPLPREVPVLSFPWGGRWKGRRAVGAQETTEGLPLLRAQEIGLWVRVRAPESERASEQGVECAQEKQRRKVRFRVCGRHLFFCRGEGVLLEDPTACSCQPGRKSNRQAFGCNRIPRQAGTRRGNHVLSCGEKACGAHPGEWSVLCVLQSGLID